MANITYGQIKEMNSKAHNGFKFDIEHYQIFRKKKLAKVITINEKQKIQATLYFEEEVKNFQETGNQIPVLNVCIWNQSNESTMWSSGLGKFHYFNEKIARRKNMTILYELSKEIGDEMIRELAVDNSEQSIYNV